MPRVVYSWHYNISFFGVEKLHPFDSRKYGRARRRLRQLMGRSLRHMMVRPRRPVRFRELLSVHTGAYLARLHDPSYVAGALEIPQLKRLPRWVIDWRILRPMRWATMGTIVAAREALQHGFAVNLGGGYHHAKPNAGEGFCLYNDIALAIHAARAEGPLATPARVAYIDLDAHQGNGVCHAFLHDHRVFIFDMYNAETYPCYDHAALERIDCKVPLSPRCTEREYLGELEGRLPGFLNSITGSERVGLAIYNAGTDIYAGDPLGGLAVTAQGISRRDQFVVDQLRQRGIPTVMVLSGGYTQESYRLVANSVVHLLEMERARYALT
jgi:histone deacetylase 11